MPTKVAIVGGTGALGLGLALRLAKAGVGVVIGSRDAGRAGEAAHSAVERLGSEATVDGLINGEAVAGKELVFLCVPFAAQVATLKEIQGQVEAGTVVVDATAPLATAYGGKPTESVGVWQGSAAQLARSILPESVEIVSGLHTVSAKSLQDIDHELSEDVFVCGDKKEAKELASSVIESIPGLRCLDCGGLSTARITEQLTPLLIGINKRYKTRHSGLRVTGLDG